MKNRGAFTLIELLVVIAIIAILAAILFPVFVNAREKGRQTACISNMSELAKALRMYLDDSDGRYPCGAGLTDLRARGDKNPQGAWVWFDGNWTSPGAYWYDNPGRPWSWRVNPAKGSIWKYTNRSRKIFICPSDKHAVDSGFTHYGAFGLSYTMNMNIVSADYGDTATSWVYDASGRPLYQLPAVESMIVRPTKTVLLADQGDGSITTSPTLRPHCGDYNYHTPSVDGTFGWFLAAPTPVHCGGQNWAFCDGHVKWTNLKQFRDLIFYRDGKPVQTQYYFNWTWTNND